MADVYAFDLDGTLVARRADGPHNVPFADPDDFRWLIPPEEIVRLLGPARARQRADAAGHVHVWIMTNQGWKGHAAREVALARVRAVVAALVAAGADPARLHATAATSGYPSYRKPSPLAWADFSRGCGPPPLVPRDEGDRAPAVPICMCHRDAAPAPLDRGGKRLARRRLRVYCGDDLGPGFGPGAGADIAFAHNCGAPFLAAGDLHRLCGQGHLTAELLREHAHPAIEAAATLGVALRRPCYPDQGMGGVSAERRALLLDGTFVRDLQELEKPERTAYLMRGLPGGGKSACARALAAALFLRHGRPCVFFDEFDKLPARTRVNPHALAGRAVVIDRTHCGEGALAETIRTLKEHDYAVCVVSVGPDDMANVTEVALHGVWLRNIIVSDVRAPVPDVAIRTAAGRFRPMGELIEEGRLPGWDPATDTHDGQIVLPWGAFVPDAKTAEMRDRLAGLPPPVEWCRRVTLVELESDPEPESDSDAPAAGSSSDESDSDDDSSDASDADASDSDSDSDGSESASSGGSDSDASGDSDDGDTDSSLIAARMRADARADRALRRPKKTIMIPASDDDSEMSGDDSDMSGYDACGCGCRVLSTGQVIPPEDRPEWADNFIVGFECRCFGSAFDSSSSGE
jgi:hypothetical protein